MPTTVEHITREHIEAFLEDIITTRATATAKNRYLSLRAFWRWATDEDYVDRNPMEKIRPPHVPPKPVPVIQPQHLRALIGTVEGRGRTDFHDRRDAALLRLMIETGCRLAEVTGLRVADVDMDRQLVTVTGKGSRTRLVPFGDRTARAIDRFIAARRRRADADRPEFWLGRRGPLTRYGVVEAIQRRCREAGIREINPHAFRHTRAHLLRVAGLGDAETMAVMGWTDRTMLTRYGSSAVQERAIDRVRELDIDEP